MKTPIYLDNNAATPLDPRVLEEMLPTLKEHFGNPASSTHRFGWAADELVSVARERVASAIGAAPDTIVFTGSASEANNLAIKGLAFAALRSRSAARRIVSVVSEHRSVLEPLDELRAFGFEVKSLPVNGSGELSSENLKDALTPNTLLVSVMLANNEVGALNDVNAAAALSHSAGALFHCDAVQAFGKIRLDLPATSADFVTLSAHKIYGPKGIGCLYIRRPQANQIFALVHGGGHEGGYHAGTLNVPGIVGFGKAAELAAGGLVGEREKLEQLSERLMLCLRSELTGVQLNGPELNRLPGNLNIAFDGVDNARLLRLLSGKVALSTSSACSSKNAAPSHVLQALGFGVQRQKSSVRIGIGRFNTVEEIDFAAAAIIEAVKNIRRG